MKTTWMRMWISIPTVLLILLTSGGLTGLASPQIAQAVAERQWIQQIIFTGNAANANFAGALALSGDGNRLVVGAGYETVNGVTRQGAAYVYMRSSGSWASYTLFASDPAAQARFGGSVDISADGSTILIGANGVNSNHGAVYVFTWNGSAWTQQQKLTASDGSANDFFGSSVALSADGSTALVGATGYTASQSHQGAAYVFTRSGGVWSQQTSTLPIIGLFAQANDGLGGAVALSADGNTALMGAANRTVNSGAAYVYTRSGTSWMYQNMFLDPGGLGNDDFGHSLALSSDGNTALIGADGAQVDGVSLAGAAYVYHRSGISWSTNPQKLSSPTPTANEFFGYSVSLSLDGLNAVAGVPNATITLNNNGTPTANVGCAWLFYGTGFGMVRKLVNSNGKQSELMGSATAINLDGTTLALGAPALTYGVTGQGGVYVFGSLASPWFKQAQSDNPDGSANDNFGFRLAISADGSTALVGTLNQNLAWVYTRSSGGGWNLQATLHSSDASPANFGSSVALSGDGNTALVGDSTINAYQGAVYRYTRSGTAWSGATKLTAPTPANGIYFGSALALSADGSTAAIGGYGYLAQQGAVYVMTHSAGGWSALTLYQANTPVSFSWFGGALALSSDGSTLLVGADSDNNGTATTTGAAYVFTRSAGVYTQQTKFSLGSGYNTSRFGYSVALSADGNTALVGAPWKGVGDIPGLASIYTRSAGVWSGPTVFAAQDYVAVDDFGIDVSLSGDGSTAVIGADRAQDYGALFEGAAYVYKHTGSQWSLAAKIIPPDTGANDGNARAVALSADGHTILINSQKPGTGFASRDTGGFYVYVDSIPFHLFIPQIKH